MIMAYLATETIKWYASQKEMKFPSSSHKFPAWSWKVAPDWSISKWIFIFLRRVWLYIDCRVTLKRKIFGLSVENEFDSDIKEIDLVCSRIFSQHSCFLPLSNQKWPFQPFRWFSWNFDFLWMFNQRVGNIFSWNHIELGHLRLEYFL